MTQFFGCAEPFFFFNTKHYYKQWLPTRPPLLEALCYKRFSFDLLLLLI